MKTLYLIRHAKSDWSDEALSDYDRPLNKRGLKDAPLMGSHLADKGIRPDLILSSPALRAKTTAKAFAKALSYPPESIRYDHALYACDALTILSLIRGVSADIDTLFVFGHNPEFTKCANLITGGDIDNIPTCGVVEMRLKNDSWESIGENSAELRSFDYPKKYR
ncbi:putative phosphohistidine phosphatase, SixA [Sulfuricurvum kujiense DSM 16994]|uniref:Phosphohistidine phosphatase, SixA n=1 Tax=Sulfuricurvum kujiense (strain ATCC BAA-921 / DSM 16994 / JCM 11577 / YK-1) TaxID=709032 RepID=E4U0L8_SULKY|nr:histidine phosphatase family protein [Sulfuricurvum kujiense]ADR34335.1 putative phosphohistidine phosphatase, SixA [Sulfuricurvum kujiense DSM 16994]